MNDGGPAGLRAIAPPTWIAELSAADAATVVAHRLVEVTRAGADRYRLRGQGEPRPATAKPVEPTVLDAYLALTRRGDAP